MGITQASVSAYLSSDAQRAYSALARFSLSRDEVNDYVDQLAMAVRKNAAEGVSTLHSIWTDILGKGSACAMHRQLYPSLADCDACIREYGKQGGPRSEAIAEVARAVKLLEGLPDFVHVMPEVSVNIACVAGNATSPADVIAVPGRIVRVRDRAMAMLPPEAGASAHMARVLLIVRNRHPEVRACINLRFDGKMAEAIRKLGLHTIFVGNYPTTGGDPTVRALERGLKASSGQFDAIIDEGRSGIEPNVYLFGKGANEVAHLASRLARAYSAA